MVLPAAATDAVPTSYRQDQTGGPAPAAVVEVPSESDSFPRFWAKALRLQRLGSVVYLVVVDGPGQGVLRLGPDDGEMVAWPGNEPIAELGGIRLGFESGALTVTTPAGLRAVSDQGLLAAAAERAEELARQLRALGVEPEAGPPGT